MVLLDAVPWIACELACFLMHEILKPKKMLLLPWPVKIQREAFWLECMYKKASIFDVSVATELHKDDDDYVMFWACCLAYFNGLFN